MRSIRIYSLSLLRARSLCLAISFPLHAPYHCRSCPCLMFLPPLARALSLSRAFSLSVSAVLILSLSHSPPPLIRPLVSGVYFPRQAQRPLILERVLPDLCSVLRVPPPLPHGPSFWHPLPRVSLSVHWLTRAISCIFI